MGQFWFRSGEGLKGDFPWLPHLAGHEENASCFDLLLSRLR